MQRFLAPVEIAESTGGRRRDRAAHSPAPCPNFKASASFRMFRPPVPAALELWEGRPTRVVFQGLRGDVLAAAGPWRTSGDWWREDGWQQDEWDLEIHFHPASGERGATAAGAAFASRPDCGLYRFYFDALLGRWFVRGVYD